MDRRQLLMGMAVAASTTLARPATAAHDFLPATRRTRQLAEFEALHLGVSFHFSVNTFTGDDYDTGKAPASTYNPTHLDVRQWIRTARDLGAKYAVLTAKHMSGFCLWDSQGYDYDVASSGNKTDVVASFVAACHEYGIMPGFDYCILDPRNEGRFDWNSLVPDSYYQLIKHHLTELHTRDPHPFYQLLDITWKVTHEQRWELYKLIKQFRPNCLIVMNQAFYQSRRNQGRICEEASWPTDIVNGEDTMPPAEGHDPHVVFQGKAYFMPMESWIPMGPPYKPMPPMHSWFWREGFKTQSAKTIAGIMKDCRDRRANLLLNLSPDTSGRLPDEMVNTLREAVRIIRS